MRSLTCIFFMMLLGLGLTKEAQAQAKWKITGQLVNESKEAMPTATVVLLDAGDSTMVQFAITNNDGAFSFVNAPQGEYLIQASFVGYQMEYQKLSLNSDLKVEPIVMKKDEVMLNDVSVATERLPMQVKDDTLQYNAAAFKTQPNSVVEDLLKKLPGVEVAKDGSIKAQGETVTKVLVDGKEFFGDDPKMATKNLPADAIDKVEVYDKLSEMSEFTGVDDGERDKTINLKLKEGAKAGYFGNVYGGVGYDPALYEGKLNVNRFNKNSQLSILAMGNNINEQGFSFQDYIQFMGGISNFMSMARNGQISLGAGDLPMGMGNSDGITSTLAGGLNYNRDWGKKTKFRSSYFYNRVSTDLQTEANRIYSDTTALASSSEDVDQDSKGNGHRFNYNLFHEMDSTQDVRLRGALSLNNGDLNNISNQLSYDDEGQLLNGFNTITSNNSVAFKGSMNLTHRKRFRSKVGRSFVTRLTSEYSTEDKRGDVINSNNRAGSINQQQFYNDRRVKLGGNLNFTEPLSLSKGYFINSRVDYTYTNNTLNKDFFDVINADERNFNAFLSNDYENVVQDRSAELRFQKSSKKISGNVGLKYQNTSQEGVLRGVPAAENAYQAWLPNASFRLRMGSGKNIRMNYSSSLIIPSLEQLQPVVDNTNPLKIYIGNPDLKASNRHSLSMNYMYYSQFSFTSFFASINGSFTDNPIQNAVMTDTLFRQVLRPVNVDSDQQLTARANFSTPIRVLGIKVGLDLNESIIRSQLPINGVTNTLNRVVHGGGAYVENKNKDYFDVRLGANLSYNQSTYSETPQNNQSFLNSEYYIDAVWFPNEKWTLKSDFSYNVYASNNFDNTQVFPMLGGSVSRRLFKDNSGELALRVVDALNQNQGFARSSQWNYLEEKVSNNLARYVMMRFTYNLKNFAGSTGGNKRKREKAKRMFER